ncbi:C-factor-like [Boleophthalmus pectinirostris]|uniref:C-factor-like n=1 Tax=Boleophthalmus pectinirostris TaxID=150288 RepID=UPI0024320738|nr:C-factor-like [Boleophthalmus pectinirostris]
MSSKPISVLITGANRGLGLEMVKQMMQSPLNVLFACCRDPDGPKAEELRALAKKHSAIIKIIRMDTADRSSIKQAAEKVGSLLGGKGLNLVINNAATLTYSNVADSTPEAMAKEFNTNVIGPMSVIQEFLPYLRDAVKKSKVPGMSCEKAAVINLSSILGSIESRTQSFTSFQTVPYRASKAGLNMLTACAAFEFQKEEILFIVLHPGWVKTDMGTADADIDAHESVQGMLQVINSLTEKHNGAFLDYKGQSIPW